MVFDTLKSTFVKCTTLTSIKISLGFTLATGIERIQKTGIKAIYFFVYQKLYMPTLIHLS